MRPQRELRHILAVAIMLNCCGVKSSLTRSEFFCDLLQGTHCTSSQHSMDTQTHAIWDIVVRCGSIDDL
jgi:hypothetical protein